MRPRRDTAYKKPHRIAAGLWIAAGPGSTEDDDGAKPFDRRPRATRRPSAGGEV